MWHLEAFAMLGALAWQAATVIKMVLVSRGEIARGLFCFSPGVSPHRVLVCSFVCTSRPIRSSWHNVLPSWIDHGATDQRPKVQSIIYSWSIHKLKTNYCSRKLYSVLRSFTQEFVITGTYWSYSHSCGKIIRVIRCCIYYHITAQICTSITIGGPNDQIALVSDSIYFIFSSEYGICVRLLLCLNLC